MVRAVKEYNPSDLSLGRASSFKVKTSGNIVDVFSAVHDTRRQLTAKRISATEYLDTVTGKIKQYQNKTDRSLSTESLRNTFQLIRDLVNANTTQPRRCRWLTLTYAINMTDPKQLYADYKRFMTRLRRKYGKCEYIAVAEPQQRGAWHMHVILIFPDDAPFMDNNDVASLWAQGFVTVKAMNNCDNIGAYLSAYLGDVALDEADEDEESLTNNGYEVREVETLDDAGNKVKKKYVKGYRLNMYPRGMNIVRTSRGVKRPVVERMDLKEVVKKTSAGTLVYSQRITLFSDETEEKQMLNEFGYFQYNLIRGHKTTKKKEKDANEIHRARQYRMRYADGIHKQSSSRC